MIEFHADIKFDAILNEAKLFSSNYSNFWLRNFLKKIPNWYESRWILVTLFSEIYELGMMNTQNFLAQIFGADYACSVYWNSTKYWELFLYVLGWLSSMPISGSTRFRMKRTNVLYGNYNICYCESLVNTFLNLMIAVESSVPHFLEFTGYKCWISRIFRHRFLPRTMQVKSSGIPLNIRNFFYMWLSDWFPSQYQVWRCFKRSLLRYYLGIIALFIVMRAVGSCRPYILGFTGLDWISRIFLAQVFAAN